MDKKLKQFYNEHSGRQTVLSEDAAKRVKENIFSNLGTMAAEEVPVSMWEKISKMFVHGYLLVPLVILLFLSGTAYASANSLPGDPLYSVKRQVENAQILVAPTTDAKLKLQENFAQKRLDELKKLQTADKTDVKSEDNNDNQTKDEQEENNVKNENNNTTNSSSEHRNDKINRRNKAQSQATSEADKALEDLRKTRRNLQDRGDEDKASQIDERVKQIQKQLDEQKADYENRGRKLHDQLDTNVDSHLLKY